jgi:cysteinyl-tRNA synthetase
MTVYAKPHLGNLRPYVFADTLRRMLEWKGIEVTLVVNITDVGHAVGDGDLGEDKVEVAARAASSSVWEVTKRYTADFFADLERMNVRPHSHNPRASDYVPQMIAFAEELERRGFTYRLESGLYFDTSRSPGYGRLALIDPSDDSGVHRVEAVPGKRSPADFAIWRSEVGDQKRLVHWDSPWGPGVPGWHLECSVMSMELLGQHFDIHTGGIDHRQIHHVNEIAQSEAYLGEPRDWVPLWLHNEFVTLGAAKISKSSGRVPILDDVVEAGHHPLAYRLFLLNAHYRRQLEFNDSGMDNASAAFRRLLVRTAGLGAPERATYDETLAALHSEPAADHLRAIDAAISDDLNTPRVLAELNAVLRDDDLDHHDRRLLVHTVEDLLGLGLGVLDPEVTQSAATVTIDREEIERLVAARGAAREARDWAEADRVRDLLAEHGVTLVDGPDGTSWRPSAR